jgi:hypothetical protein
MQKIDVDNFKDFTEEEYRENLEKLGGSTHESLVGSQVYYSKKIYGLHTIVKWDPKKGEFLLDLDGSKIWSNPFRIFK